jgi:hypothetical protein
MNSYARMMQIINKSYKSNNKLILKVLKLKKKIKNNCIYKIFNQLRNFNRVYAFFKTHIK